MKGTIIFLLLVSKMSLAQKETSVDINELLNDTLYQIKTLPGFFSPEKGYKTILSDRKIKGKIIEFCKGEYVHLTGNKTIGLIGIITEKDSIRYNILFANSSDISLEIGDEIEVEVGPYSFSDHIIQRTNGFICRYIDNDVLVLLK